MKAEKIKSISGVIISFAGFIGLILFLSANQTITPQQAGLMIIALIALYLGFGFLIAVYRLVTKLD